MWWAAAPVYKPCFYSGAVQSPIIDHLQTQLKQAYRCQVDLRMQSICTNRLDVTRQLYATLTATKFWTRKELHIYVIVKSRNIFLYYFFFFVFNFNAEQKAEHSALISMVLCTTVVEGSNDVKDLPTLLLVFGRFSQILSLSLFCHCLEDI